jgi:hypothetical protein
VLLPKIQKEKSSKVTLQTHEGLKSRPTLHGGAHEAVSSKHVGGSRTAAHRSPNFQLSRHNSSKKLSFIEQKEQNILKQKELDDRIDRVISQTLDAETKAVLYRQNSLDNQQRDQLAMDELLSDEGAQTKPATSLYSLELDGFEIDEDPKRPPKKIGAYEMESVEKLKEKGYNLFREITRGERATQGAHRNLFAVDEAVVRKARRSKFFKEFVV